MSLSICTCFLLLLLIRGSQTQIKDGLYYPPIFTNLTDRIEVYSAEGGKFEWPCEARSNPPSNYAWYHNGDRLSATWLGGKVRYDDNAGTLYIEANENTVGTYYCRAVAAMPRRGISAGDMNSLVDETVKATAQSMSITLRLAGYAPFPESDVQSRASKLGDYVRFNCSSPTYEPRANFHWQTVESVDKLSGPRYFVEPITGDLHVLSVENDTEALPDGIECCATNRINEVMMCGSKQRVELDDSVVALERPPVLRYRTSSEDSVFTEGDNIGSISCAFSGFPMPQVEWKRTDGGPLRGQPLANSNGHTLRFSNVSRQHVGSYQCRASNSRGFSEWLDVTVYVRTRPVFLQPFEYSVRTSDILPIVTRQPSPSLHKSAVPANVEGGLVNMTVGTSVLFNCSCVGDPQAVIVWTVNGMPVDMPGGLPFSMANRVSQRRPENTLLMSDVQLSDNGNVVACECRNSVGRALRLYGLLVFEQTQIIERPPVSNTTSKGAIYGNGNGNSDTLVIDVDESAVIDMTQFAKRNVLRCSARADPLTQLTLTWWHVEYNKAVALATTPYQDELTAAGSVQPFEYVDTDLEERLVTPVSTEAPTMTGTPPYMPSSDPVDWLSSTVEYQNALEVAIATLDVRAMLTVAWRMRESHTIFRVPLECRATNTLSRATYSLTVLLNTSAYVHWRLAQIAPRNISVPLAPVVEAGVSTWVIVVPAVCGSVTLIVAVVVAVICARRRHGASYPLEKHELATGRDPLLELRISGFNPLIRQNDVVRGRLFESLEPAFAAESDEIASSNGERSKSALLDDDDTFVTDFERGEQHVSLQRAAYGTPMSMSTTPSRYALPNGDNSLLNPSVAANGTLTRTLASSSARTSAERDRSVPQVELSRYSLTTFATGTAPRSFSHSAANANLNIPYEPVPTDNQGV